ncbi:gamma-glutamylcyclotransferase family protein [Mucilaginibacter sp.]|uniref:gamma-glutamylcyclotransferase family protein n=1 Tax=Mucilaginibacter sp. TaxID=1882438 RepID=UPI003D0B61EE
MIDNISYLFVYGTLLDQRNQFGAYLSANCIFYADGNFSGELYDTGEYPGAVAMPGSNSKVYGKIFSVHNTDEVFKQLDEYEGYGPGEIQPNLFIRNLMQIETNSGPLECWVYLYNWPVNDFVQITTGSYAQYISTGRNSQY